MNQTTYTNLRDRRSKSAPAVCWTQEELAKNLRQWARPTTRRAPARVEAPVYVSDSDVLYFVRLFEVKPAYLFPEFDREEHIGAAVRRLLSRKEH